MSADLLAADLRRVAWRPLSRGLALITLLTVATSGIVAVSRSGRHPVDLRTDLPSAFEHAAAPLALAAFVLGASLLGADYASRTLSTTLVWEPRRQRVLASRAAIGAITAGCATLATLTLLTVALLPAALAHSGGPFADVASLIGLAVRCAALAAASATLGVSCAVLTRSTIGALGSLAAYWLLAQLSVVGLWPSAGRWLLLADAQSWIVTDHNSWRQAAPSTLEAGLLILGTVLLLHAAATWRILRQDID